MISPRRSELHVDVLVVGARAAGAATALQLARRGLRVLAVDRAPAGSDTLSTHALMRTGVVQLSRWGLLDDVVESGAPVIGRTVFHYGADSTAVDIAPDRFSSGLLAPRRAVLDSLLVHAASDAGADIRHSCRVKTLLRDRGQRVVGAILNDGREHRIRADLVVGADGADSTVAAQVGAATLPVRTHGWTATIYAYVDGFDDDTSHWYFSPSATAGVIPTNDARACVFVAVPATAFPALRPDVLGAWRRLLGQVAPTVADHVRTAAVSRMRSFPGRRPHVRQPHGAGWMLVGDAGLYDDPATAHGISAALRDAELVADAMSTGDHARYRRRRDDLARPISAVTNRIASMRWDFDELRALHLELSDAMRREVTEVASWPTARQGRTGAA